MKVLVTGAGGFLGGAVVERLLAHGEKDLRLFVRPASKRARLDAVLRKYPEAKVELFTGSLTNPDDCRRAIEGVDVIYHLAAGTGGAAADLFLHSVVASQKLLDAVVASGRKPKVVLCSSFGVYGVATMGRGAMLDETAPLEAEPNKRDLYSQAKLRQEQLFWDAQAKHGFPMVVVRPGVIYGPGSGTAISSRVGLNLFGVFLHLGRDNLLPLSYVDNCAEAIVVAGRNDAAVGKIFNLVDDDLPTCRAYLRRYQKEVAKVRAVRLPYLATLALSVAVEKYHRWSKGQLPAVFTPYKTATTWGGNKFSNAAIKSVGWRPIVSTDEGIRRTFEELKAKTRAA